MTPTGEELATLRDAGQSWGDIYKLFPNKNRSTLRKRYSRYVKRINAPQPDEPQEIKGVIPGRVDSVIKLFEAFDIDPEKYELTHVKVNTWEQHSVAKGHVTLYQINANLKPRPDHEALLKLEALRESIRKDPIYPALPERDTTPSDPLLATLNMPDLHLGKQADKPYAPEDYNLKTAVNTYKKALRTLLDRIDHLNITEVWLPTGNDLIHIDNLDGTTTSGTYVMPNANFKLLWATAHDLIRDSIKTICQRQPQAHITIPIVPGNHDALAAYTLGMALQDLYHQEPRVTVITADFPRLYLTFGQNLIGFHHGNKTKPQDLANAMPEQPTTSCI